MRAVFLLPLFIVLAGCPSVEAPPETTGPINVGPSGGTFSRDGMTIEVPPDALQATSVLTVTKLIELPDVEGRVPISEGYQLGPAGLIFKKPITVTVPFQPERVPSPQIDPSAFDMRRQVAAEGIKLLVGGGTDVLTRTVSAESERLGLFWATSPLPPGPTTIELSPEQAVLQPGGSQAFTATVKDEAGVVMTDVQVTWEIFTPRMASVDDSGTVTAIAPGIATVVARAGGAEGVARVLIPGQPTGASTFIHENPFPTGEDLHAGVILRGQPMVAGGNGTVLLRDASSNWSRLFSSSGVTFRAVASAGDFLVGAGSFGTTGVLFEQSTSGLKTASLRDFRPRTIWFDGTHGMVAGTGNDLLVRRNGTWVEDDSPTFQTVLSVKGDGNGSFTVLNDLGEIYRYDPTTQAWAPIAQERLPVLLAAGTLVDDAGSEAWAMGALDLHHYKNGVWTLRPLPSSAAGEVVTAIGVARNRVHVATVKQGVSRIRSFDPVTAEGGGNGWVSVQTVRAPQIIRSLFGDATQAFAVGDLGAIWEFDGSTNFWRERSSGFYDDVVGVSAGPGITVVSKRICLNAACDLAQGEVLRREGSGAWQKLGTVTFPSPVVALLARSANEVYAGGAGYLLKWDGSAWVDVSVASISGQTIRSLAWCGSALNAVGTNGNWWRGTNQLSVHAQLKNASNMLADLHGISCTSADNVFSIGSGTLFENRVLRQNVDNPLTSTDEAEFQAAAWTQVWTPGGSEAYAFGNTYYGGMWNGHDLAPIGFPAIPVETVSGLWGTSIESLYAVGFTAEPLRFGFAMIFDGVNWNWIDLGTERRPYGISGRSPTDSYVVTAKGGILRAVPPAP